MAEGGTVNISDFLLTLNENLEKLDDDEFHLPKISELPTLESILNEEDDPGSISDDEVNSILPQESKKSIIGDSGETASVHSSSDTRSKTSSGCHFKRESRRRSHGSILRHVVLKGISSQLISANQKVGAGHPSTMDVGPLICVGTSHGLILVFEHTQILKWCLGSTELAEQYGGVSSLAINQDGSKLLAGFTKGHVCLYDLNNGKLLQNIPDAHTPFSAVLHIKWTDSPGLALLSDSGGSVFEVSIKRLMGLNSNESRCIFSGSRGEVCTIEPLNMGQFLNLPPIVDTVMVALGTISKVIVMSLRPHLKVYFSKQLLSTGGTLPLLAWQFVIIQLPDGSKVIDPVLAFGRDSMLYFYQLTHGSREELLFLYLQELRTPYTIQSIVWLNSRCLAVMDTIEKLHVIDVKTREELDTVDLARLGLVYATAHFKGLSTGGNVSKAMAFSGEKACYHSMKTLGAQVLLLGTKSFQVVTLRNWSDRINYLVKTENVGDALQLCIDILQQKALGIVGLPQHKDKRKQTIKEKMSDLMLLFVTKSKKNKPNGENGTKLINYYQQSIPLCVKVALIADFHDLLFSTVWEEFSTDSVPKGIFLESLEPYILNDQLTDISPLISQCLLSHYESIRKLEAIEACIVRLAITSLDLHQTMVMCTKYGLYDGIFYVSTQGFNDYITPLEDLIILLKTSINQQSDLTPSKVSLGNKILVYVSSCLAGRAYPRGNIAEADIKQVKHDVFKCISSIHSKNHSDEEQSYPFLRTLLHFDTREFLNVLALAFEEAEFTSELGLVQRQRIVDILLQIMTGSDQFKSNQIASLFTFIARQISKQEGPIVLTQSLFDQILQHLTDPEDSSHHEERESSLLQLLTEGHLKQLNSNNLLIRAEKARFYRVCEYLYDLNGDYERVLFCYVKDDVRKHQAFSYIKKFLVSPKFTSSDKHKIKNQAKLLMKELIKIDSDQLALMLLSTEEFSDFIIEIVKELQNDPRTCYDLLHSLFTCKSQNTTDGIDKILYPELQEMLIDLMAQIDPDNVVVYLKEVNGYRFDECLKICEKYQIQEGRGFLMEKTEHYPDAFNIYMELLQFKVNQVKEYSQENDQVNISLFLGQARLQATKIIRICDMASQNVDEEARKEFWFPFLEVLLSLQPLLSVYEDHIQDLRNLIGVVVNRMMPHISLAIILERIVENSDFHGCHFGQIKHLLGDMVDIYQYEKVLFSTTVKIIREDHLQYIKQMKKQVSAPLSIDSNVCCLCRVKSTAELIAFPCGHFYHYDCGRNAQICSVCIPSAQNDAPNTKERIVEEEIKLKQSQREGLKKMAVLDSHVVRSLVLGNLSERRKNGDFSNSENFLNNQFALKLSPKGEIPSDDF